MQIHQRFKDHLKELIQEISAKVGLTDIDNIPNEDIIAKLYDIYMEPSFIHPTTERWQLLMYTQLQSEEGEYHLATAVFKLENIKAICDTYIWYGKERPSLISWSWFVNNINARAHIQTEEEELFKTGKVIKVWAVQKLRGAGFLQSHEDDYMKGYIGCHYKVLGYNKDWFTLPDEVATNIRDVYIGRQRHKKVYLEDAYGNVYAFPQSALIPTTTKDLVVFQKELAIRTIIDRLENTAKFDIERLSKEYQSSLRKFMVSSKVLHEKISWNFTEEAERIYEIQINMKDVLENNVQIQKVIYEPSERLIIETRPLWNSGKPIGKYSIDISLRSWGLKILNIDIWGTHEHQHPHINRVWAPCLWQWVNPLREAHSNSDYITLVAGIISYLEDLNPDSVFIWMGEFQSKNRSKFKYQVDAAKEEKEKAATKEVPVITTEEVIETPPVTTPAPAVANEATDTENPTPRYQVGNRVRIINDDQAGFPIGSECIIHEIIQYDQDMWRLYGLMRDGSIERFWHHEQFLSPLTI